TDYPSPAGGCLLTESAFGRRFYDLKSHNPNFSFKDVILLKFGRHFRINDSAKAIIGRNKDENEEILKHVGPEDVIFEVIDYKGPVGLYFGKIEESLLSRVASIIVAYSKAPKNVPVKVKFYNRIGFEKIIESKAASLEYVHNFLIK
ncbi:MAG: tRNA (5-methylaminomethyl-2-thiouridylate)-methyltransferase, partial [Nitrososphaeria archaeon]